MDTDMTPRRILVVDDRENWRSQLRLMLEEEAYEVETAESYETAMQALSRGVFHLALVDVRLIDADETNADGLRLIAAIEENRWPTPVIAITGYSRPEYGSNPELKSPLVKGFLRKQELDTGRLLQLIAESIETPKEH